MNKPSNIKTFSSNEFVNNSAQELKTIIEGQLKETKIINIALSGGNSPLPIYKMLGSFKLEWERINFFLVDERCVTNDDKQSNYGNINKCFFSHIYSESFPVIKEGISYLEAAAQYQELIMRQVNIVDEIPQFDIVILGMGIDGHTASLFPGTNALKNNEDLMVLNNVPQLKTNRITMTYPLILNAKKIVLIANGKAKKNILDNVFKKEYPISKIIPQINTIFN